jgi:hypothetical protein
MVGRLRWLGCSSKRAYALEFFYVVQTESLYIPNSNPS